MDRPRPEPMHGYAGAPTGGRMPRKPNYRFERSERERQKAAKKAARLAAKQERSEAARDKNAESRPPEPTKPKAD